MSSFTWHPTITKKQKEKACKGKICPQCLSTNVKCVGHAFDGINMNAAYDCQSCDAKWEGY